MYECSTEAEARERTGRKPVGLKWIDFNKGSAEAPRHRSRLVCTEVRHKGVEPIFSTTLPLETLRVLISVACQEDVFRHEDPFRSPLQMRVEHTSTQTQFATSTSDCQTRTPRQSSQVCAGNCERRCTVLWMLPNVVESTMLRLWRREDFPEAWLLRATSSKKACKPTFWCMVTIFS